MRTKNKYGNQYLLTENGGIWVRNYTGNGEFLDINKLIRINDYQTFLDNENRNRRLKIERIDTRNDKHDTCIIVSDGYGFEKIQPLLAQIPRQVAIMGVNGTLAKWDITLKRPMNYYIVNNPYSECMNFLPTKHRYYPRCVASTKTFNGFIRAYRGHLSSYSAVPQENFATTLAETFYSIDDYRNPICAAIGLCYRFGVNKILLLCCDDSFKEERPGSQQLENGLWSYPQQLTIHNILDAYAYWFISQENMPRKIADFSSGPKYQWIEYIDSDKDMLNYILEDEGVIHEL